MSSDQATVDATVRARSTPVMDPDASRGSPVPPRAAARLVREAEALRANLRRRKEQQRARESTPGAASGGASREDGDEPAEGRD